MQKTSDYNFYYCTLWDLYKLPKIPTVKMGVAGMGSHECQRPKITFLIDSASKKCRTRHQTRHVFIVNYEIHKLSKNSHGENGCGRYWFTWVPDAKNNPANRFSVLENMGLDTLHAIGGQKKKYVWKLQIFPRQKWAWSPDHDAQAKKFAPRQNIFNNGLK